MDNDFESDFIDQPEGLDDFESEAPESTDSLSDTRATNDVVADILMSGGADAPEGGTKGRSHNVRDVDGSGKPDYQTNAKEEDTSYLDSLDGNRSAPDVNAPQQVMRQAESEGQRLQQMQSELQASFRDGRIGQADYQRQMEWIQGNAAGLTIKYQQAQLESLQNQQWLDSQVAAVKQKHSDIWDDPVKKEVYSKRAIQHLGELGLSADEISELGAREYNHIMSHLKMQDRVQELEAQNKLLKKERAQRRQSGKQGRRDMQAGRRGSSDSSTVTDDVARILLSGGK